ncbi:obscurin-like protein 1 isoform X6 [Salmo salar]|uniref:Obscurin-like protein 1 n=1 Tax=Salmo salar TaxID=8030 RepID=A0A1S3NVU2_SALSA|nr:obscurin-like protein 1 isoform X6 [Salmo salar]|eukprot:XP_014019365.1 PREDICTED: obscurin-like protein 1 isoform X6 [Salmo salar]
MDVFGGAPRFLAYPRPVVVQSGTDAVLKCQIGGDPRPAVIWERNNEQIHPEGRYRFFEDGNVYNLIISSVTTEDSGQYTCKAKNSIGETYAAATLKVEGEAQEMELREENKPRFLIKPLSTRVGRGEDAVFSCKLWGNPRPEVVWEKDGRKLNEIFESTHFNVGYQDGGWFQLKIFKTRAPDGGVYTCKARNEFGEGLAGAVLLVDAGPGHEEEGNRNGYTNGHWKGHQGKQRSGRQLTTRLKDDPVTHQAKQVKMFAVTEGKHAKFRCFVTGKPKPEIIWRKDGRLIMSGRRYLLYEDREGYFTLKVLYCKQQDNGVYVCAASNTAGQTLSAVHLSVKEPPVRFKQPLIDLEVWERDLAVLECEVPEDSVPITWYLEDRRLQPGAKYGMEEWGTKRRLTIRDIGVDDDGIYLCEMADGGRSIAEVAVKGTIVRKLPRKVDVLEGENAAFCVEVEEEEMDIHWYKEGTELRETHQTILKSFGKTHILVFVNTTPQDSGLVTFFVGRSKTSSQLRVKAARHSPPSCPVGVQINTERANAALLSWVPAQDTRKNPPSGYVLERQEVGTGSQEWLQCLTTDSATSVEILGDSVPCEADYRFRICSVNKYGRSNNLEFPRAVHLVPVTRIQAPLQDALVPEGQDACFSIELTASVIGSWFLNGTQLLEDDRYSMRRSRTHQSLRIQGVRDTDNGAEITFIAYGIRDSAALYIQAPLVKFTPLSEMDRNKFVELGNPIVLYCELSDPAVPVHWYKNGVEVHTVEGLHIQSEGTMRRIVIQSSEFSHSGVYCCDAIDDVIRFNVEVEAPPVRFSALPEAERNKSVEAGCPIVLQCELSDPTAQVYWYKDGTKLLPQSGIEIQSDGITRTLVVQSAEIFYSGSYSCKTKGDAIKFNVDVKVQPVRFSVLPEAERNKSIEAGCPIVLKCELSDPTAQVYWYKDGTKLFSNHELDIQSEGNMRMLVVQSAELTHSGTYSCTTVDDTMEFHVDIKAVPVTFSAIFDVEKTKSVEAGCPFQLQCEVTDPTAQVYWCKDGEKLLPQTGMDIQSNGTMRRLIVQSAEVFHSGLYNCETSDDTLQFTVDIKAPPVKFLPSPEVVKSQLLEATCPIELPCEISDPIAQVSRQKDKVELISDTGPFEMEGIRRNLVVEPAHPSNSGAYYCATAEDVAPLIVQNQAPPMTYLVAPEVEKNKSIEAGLSIVQQFEISDPIAQVCWHKDGTQIYPYSGLDRQSKGSIRTLFIQPDDMSCGGRFDCQTTGDTTQFNVAIKAELSHPGSEKGEISDESSQYTMDIKATPVRVSADQAIEKNKSIEEVCPVEVHCEPLDSTVQILHYKDGQHLQTYEIYSMEMPRLQSVEHFSIETPTVQPAEHYSMETATLHSPELYGSMETAPFQSAELYGSMQTPTIQSAELYGSMQTPTVQSAELYGTMHTPTHQSAEVCGSMQTLTLQSAELYDSMQTQTLQSAELYGSIHTPTHQSTEVCGSMQTPTFHSPEVCGSIQTPTLQSAELCCSMKTPTLQSAELCTSMKTPTLQSAELYQLGECDSQLDDDDIAFKVDVEAPPVRITTPCEAERNKSVAAGSPIVLRCEISDPNAHVSWYKDGTLLHEENGLEMQSKGSIRTLDVESARLSDAGSYSCKTTDDAMQFHVDVKAPPPKFSAISEADKKKYIKSGYPIVLQCELSDPTTKVNWYKNGTKLLTQSGVDIQSDGTMRTLVIQSAELSHSGVYRCETMEDGLQFTVEVKAPPVRFSALPEAERNKFIEDGCPIILQCELSDPTAQVYWYKDGTKLLSQSGMDIQSDGIKRTLLIQSAEISHGGTYECSTAGDIITFKVEIKAPSQKIMPLSPMERNKSVEIGTPIVLQCELSDPLAQVCWSKDEMKLFPKTGLDIQSEANVKRLVIHSAELSDSGLYCCSLADDAMTFKVDVQALPVRFSALPEVVRNKFIEAGCPIVLQCELSDPTAQVFWYKDGTKLLPENGVDIQSEGALRAVILQSAELSHSGVYSCEALDDCIAFKVDVAAPPVTFVDIPEEDLFKSVVEQDSLVMSCEVSRVDAIVQWYKDGVETQSSDNVSVQADCTVRMLTIQSAQLSDSGTYTCRAGDRALMFKVNIREPPVMIVYPKEDVHLDRHVPEEIILSCELSRLNGVVNWFKDGQKLQESENIKLKIEGPYRRLKILCSGVEDSGEYVCDTADDSIFFNLSITEPPVQIISPSQSQMELCQQTSERMVLSCEISRPNAVVRWYRDGLEVEENDNLILEVDGVYRRLIIPETTVKDSAEYVCDTADDNMTFFVNIADPPVRFVRPRKMASRVEMFVGDSLVLDCEVSRSNAAVSWKKNGEEMEESSNVTVIEDGVMRQLTIHSMTLEDAGQYVCDAKDDVMDFQVKIKETPVKILGKNDVNTQKQFFTSDDIVLGCELSRANCMVVWYKDNKKIDDNERYCSEEQGVFRSLVVLNAEIDDSGEYTCDAGDDKMVFCITVKEPLVTIIGNSGNPEHHSLVAGDKLILECEISCPNATVQWLWNGKLLSSDARTHIDSDGATRKLVLSELQPSDSGEYILDAINDKMVTIVEVQEPPVKFVNKQARTNISGYENESVTLCAMVNREQAYVRWLKDGELLNGDNIHISSAGKMHTLTINPLKLSDSGGFVCNINTDEMYFIVQVKEMKVKFSRPLENIVALKDSTLTLRCEVNKPKGDVQWLKDGQEIKPSRQHTIRAQGRERSITIHQLMLDNAGEYACESTDDRTFATVGVEMPPPIVEFIAELHNITVLEGEDATFKCVVSPEDTLLVWSLNGRPIAPNERFVISSNGLCHMLCIYNCQVSDCATVTAEAEGLVSEANLQVQEQQVLFTKNMVPVVAEQFGEATLEVEVGLDSGEVQWMRQGVVIHPGPKFTLKQKSRRRSLTIHKLALSDRGTYSCETLHDRTQAQLIVEPRKITIRRGLTDIQTIQRETASFEVELSHSNVEATWLKDGNQLKPNNHWRMSAKGCVHSLTISNLTLDDTGTFVLSAENVKSSARLIVKEPPVTVIKKLEDLRFPEAAVASMDCELSRPHVEVKWMKNGIEVKPRKDLRIYAMGRKHYFQILKCEVSDSGTYSCDAGDSSTSCNIEVYGKMACEIFKRELVVLQGLKDLDIQEDQNAVFVVEISLEDVPGEWLKNGVRITPTSTIKIRQEGTKHFLLMCNVRGEDSGEIKFVAKHVECTAYLEVEELPLNITTPLQDKVALERSRAIMDCSVSNPRCSIRWYKGSNVILPSERFEICSEGCYRKLVIQQVALDDEGTYSVQVGEHTCSAKLTVEAQSLLMVRELKSVEVVAPDEACFECEVSVPILKAPVWSLKGEALQQGPKVSLEKIGMVHRLTLRQTSVDMNGLVEFTSGKAKSSAELHVRSRQTL